MHHSRTLLAAVILALGLPVATHAQLSPNGDSAPSDAASAEQLRGTARAAALNAVSQQHRNQIQGIIDRFNTGDLFFDDAARQIDAILSTDETKALLAQQKDFRSKLRRSEPDGSQSAGGPPEGTPPGGFPGGGPSGGFHHHGHPDAGRYLLEVAGSRQSFDHAQGPP